MMWLSLLFIALYWENPVEAFTIASVSLSSPNWVKKNNEFTTSECDDNNVPPSLSILSRSIRQLESGSDVRGQFVDHLRVGSVVSVAQAIASRAATQKLAPLTPFAAYCLGYAFATYIIQEEDRKDGAKDMIIAIGRDPREHGPRLADSFARGALSVEGVRVVYTGIATTPAMFEFCRSGLCDAGVMVSASHLPADRNGFKFFGRRQGGGFTKARVQQLCQIASLHVGKWQDAGFLPPSSGKDAVFCSEWVNFMPFYADTLKKAILRENELYSAVPASTEKPLQGLRIVLNSGNGSGGFFQEVLESLGADVSKSIHLDPDPSFPAGVPNPEYAPMIDLTTRVCEVSNAHLGIMLDTDADRSGFIVPRTVSADGQTCSNYEVLNRNRLIAVLAVIFAQTSPGCAVVTDSVTSEGLAKFLTQTLGLQHIRYLKGYANVIGKAKEVTERGIANAEMAIETSGHCAMKENGYLDDGTYTSVKVVSLLARIAQESPGQSLLDLISELEELDHVREVRFKVLDGSLETTGLMFDFCALEIEHLASKNKTSDDVTAVWEVDKDNLEGIRVRTGPSGGFFMLRKSLHDPIISLQVEASSKEEAQTVIIEPLLRHFRSEPQISIALDLSVLENYY